MIVHTPDDEQAAAALDLIVAQQQDATTTCPYLGTERPGVLAELEDLSPSWRETLRVGLRDGEVAACACVDHDAEDTRRSWIQGPWAADDDAWAEFGEALLDAMITQVPDAVEDHEVCGTPVNDRIVGLGESRGWHRSSVNIAYVARDDAGWPEPDERVRPANAEDLAAVAELHQAAFPGTYASAEALLADPDRVTLVLDGGLGYASAEVKPDGEGYLDFIAVAPEARGQGLSKPLLAAIGRAMLAASPNANVNLTVKEDNAPAVALYEDFGFVRDIELVAYRTRPYAH